MLEIEVVIYVRRTDAPGNMAIQINENVDHAISPEQIRTLANTACARAEAALLAAHDEDDR